MKELKGWKFVTGHEGYFWVESEDWVTTALVEVDPFQTGVLVKTKSGSQYFLEASTMAQGNWVEDFRSRNPNCFEIFRRLGLFQEEAFKTPSLTEKEIEEVRNARRCEFF